MEEEWEELETEIDELSEDEAKGKLLDMLDWEQDMVKSMSKARELLLLSRKFVTPELGEQIDNYLKS